MKKILVVLLIMSMGMTLLVGCGGSGDKDVNNDNGTYGIMEFEYYENGETKTETTYKEDGSKIVFSFDENGEYVSATEYDKDGNVIGNN